MAEERLDTGLIQVYTGDGKGKTTCALGLALRAAGQGFRVYIIQFMKGRKTGESFAVARLAPEVTLRHFGRGNLVNLRAPAPEDLALVQEAWALAREVLAAGEHDLVILDEINLALTHKLVPLEEALEVLRRRPARGGGGAHRPPGPAGGSRAGGPGHGNAAGEALLPGWVKARRGIEW